MKQIIKTLELPEGKFETSVDVFDENDREMLASIYKNWLHLSKLLKAIHGRGINLPEVLSESIFCMATGAVRIINSIPGANCSFDVYDLDRSKRIQIKACSVIPDLTSFGPDSVWDELYFLDFYRQGKWDGTIDFYLIPNEKIYNYPVNANQTFRQQQKQRRRPRFSIYTGIIEQDNLIPSRTFRL